MVPHMCHKGLCSAQLLYCRVELCYMIYASCPCVASFVCIFMLRLVACICHWSWTCLGSRYGSVRICSPLPLTIGMNGSAEKKDLPWHGAHCLCLDVTTERSCMGHMCICTAKIITSLRMVLVQDLSAHALSMIADQLIAAFWHASACMPWHCAQAKQKAFICLESIHRHPVTLV